MRTLGRPVFALSPICCKSRKRALDKESCVDYTGPMLAFDLSLPGRFTA